MEISHNQNVYVYCCLKLRLAYDNSLMRLRYGPLLYTNIEIYSTAIQPVINRVYIRLRSVHAQFEETNGYLIHTRTFLI